mmetsp:Transcript_9365/g.26346  ORF Transcript_9365/g.26346 Transcript_9365/m.26346 type:complete len:222 (+) Transcript_9365:614-1279(+)
MCASSLGSPAPKKAPYRSFSEGTVACATSMTSCQSWKGVERCRSAREPTSWCMASSFTATVWYVKMLSSLLSGCSGGRASREAAASMLPMAKCVAYRWSTSVTRRKTEERQWNFQYCHVSWSTLCFQTSPPSGVLTIRGWPSREKYMSAPGAAKPGRLERPAMSSVLTTYTPVSPPLVGLSADMRTACEPRCPKARKCSAASVQTLPARQKSPRRLNCDTG